jgi:hypothetical protein
LLLDSTGKFIQTGIANNEHLCQQVHLAGRLLIAGAVIVGVAFILSVVIAGLSWRPYTQTAATTTAAATTAAANADEKTDVGATEATTATASQSPFSRRRRHRHRHPDNQAASDPATVPASTQLQPVLPSYMPYVSHVTLLLIIAATVLFVLGHLLGVNSLVNDQAPNSDYASAGQLVGSTSALNNGPWYMGRASLAYMTITWLFSGLSAWIGSWGWNL